MQLFTVEQANRTLPLVRRIVEDVVAEARHRDEARIERDLFVGGTRIEGDERRAVALERRVQQVERELDQLQRELADLGIQLKDQRIGLVDFPSNLDGRRVLLCWKLGEPSVQFWHDEGSGFAGRQPLAPSLVG